VDIFTHSIRNNYTMINIKNKGGKSFMSIYYHVLSYDSCYGMKP